MASRTGCYRCLVSDIASSLTTLFSTRSFSGGAWAKILEGQWAEGGLNYEAWPYFPVLMAQIPRGSDRFLHGLGAVAQVALHEAPALPTTKQPFTTIHIISHFYVKVLMFYHLRLK